MFLDLSDVRQKNLEQDFEEEYQHYLEQGNEDILTDQMLQDDGELDIDENALESMSKKYMGNQGQQQSHKQNAHGDFQIRSPDLEDELGELGEELNSGEARRFIDMQLISRDDEDDDDGGGINDLASDLYSGFKKKSDSKNYVKDKW